jgi:hypothetical protein
MMGEPVEVYAVYWELSPIINLRTGSTPISTMPAKVQEAYAKVSLHYKSKFVIDLYESNNYLASFRFSGGSLKKSGAGYSFDTPGSPSWNKYMLKSSSGNDYYSKKDAISIFKNTPVSRASFSFSKIEDLAFSSLYALNSALKPKKEKRKTDRQTKKDPLIPKKSSTQNTTTQIQSHTAPTNTQVAKDVQRDTYSNMNHNTVNASLLLLIDVSGSMQGAKLRSAKKAALESIKTSLRKGVEVSILAFSGSCNSPISKRINFTTNEQSQTY